uniref:KIB1-4 beta-propeller domain-containing protein n=1 Tax=Oryza glaberrima TaxID=4538 RepID=I1P6T6_ORYGL
MSSSRSQNRQARSSKRRRRTAADAAAATGDPSPWESLHEDLLGLIAWRVLAGDDDLLDYVRFRAVCPHWRSSTACPRGRGIVDRRFHPRRWMLLPEGHGLYPGHGKLRGFVRFFNLSTGAFVRVHLPLFRDHCVLDSVDGILLLQRDHDTAIRLLHPFTGDILDFPPLETLRRYVSSKLVGDKWNYLRRIGAASINVSADQVVSLMMWSPGMVQVAFATSGEQQWRASSWYFKQIFSPLAFQGKMYMVRHHLTYGEPEILQIDPPQLEGTEFWLPPPTLIAKCPANTANTSGSWFSYHLVECDSEVLVIALSTGIHRKISVYRLADFMLGRRTLRVTCIGGNALFIGKRNLCVSSKAFPTVVGDTIVFHHYQQGYLAQYHLSSGTLLPASDGTIAEYAIPSPCSIIYHIYTCCFREQWNKGHIRFQGLLTINWRVKRKWRSGVA